MRAMAKRVQNLRNKKISDVPADDLIKKKRRASIELSGGETQDEHDEQVDHSSAQPPQPKLSVSDVPSIEVKEAKVFNLPSPNGDDKADLKQFEELEKAIMTSCNDNNISPTDKTSRDSGVSDGSTPDQEPISTSIRNPSDPLPQAPVKAEIVTNEIEPELETNASNSRVKPPPYHIAAQMSRHANDFQLERKSSFMSDVTMESISGIFIN